MLLTMLICLYFYISTSRSLCAVPNMAVFCSTLISCFPLMFLRNCLSDFEMVPVALIFTHITFVFTFHIWCISVVRFLYFRIFSVSFLITDYGVRFFVRNGSVYLHFLLLLLLLLGRSVSTNIYLTLPVFLFVFACSVGLLVLHLCLCIHIFMRVCKSPWSCNPAG